MTSTERMIAYSLWLGCIRCIGVPNGVISQNSAKHRICGVSVFDCKECLRHVMYYVVVFGNPCMFFTRDY